MANSWAYLDEAQYSNATFLTALHARRLRENAVNNLNYRTPHYSEGIRNGDEPVVSTPSTQWRAFPVLAWVRQGRQTARVRIKLTCNPTGFTNGENAIQLRLCSQSATGELVTVTKSASAQTIELSCLVNSPRGMVQAFEIQLRSRLGAAYSSTADVIAVDQQHILITQNDLSAVYGAVHFEIVRSAATPSIYVGRIEASYNNPLGNYHARSQLIVHPWITTAEGWPSLGNSKIDCDMYYLGTAKIFGWSIYFDGADEFAADRGYNAGQPVNAEPVTRLLSGGALQNPRNLPLLYPSRGLNTLGKLPAADVDFAGAYFKLDNDTRGFEIHLRVAPKYRAPASGAFTIVATNITRGSDITKERNFNTPMTARGTTEGTHSLAALGCDLMPAGWGGADLEFTQQFAAYAPAVVVRFNSDEISMTAGDEFRLQIECSAEIRVAAGVLVLRGGPG